MMDEEAMREITEFAELLYNFREAMDIKSIESSIVSFLLANHYVILPKDKPPILTNEEIIKAYDSRYKISDGRREVAKAQRELDIKHYETLFSR